MPDEAGLETGLVIATVIHRTAHITIPVFGVIRIDNLPGTGDVFFRAVSDEEHAISIHFLLVFLNAFPWDAGIFHFIQAGQGIDYLSAGRLIRVAMMADEGEFAHVETGALQLLHGGIGQVMV